MSAWKGLGKRERELAEMDVDVLGVSADSPERQAALRDELGLPFTLLSDPELASADLLGCPTSTTAAFAATVLLHPSIAAYPKKAFLQPALFVWLRDGTLAHEWRLPKQGLTNLYGARGRPGADDVLRIVREALG